MLHGVKFLKVTGKFLYWLRTHAYVQLYMYSTSLRINCYTKTLFSQCTDCWKAPIHPLVPAVSPVRRPLAIISPSLASLLRLLVL